MDARPQARSEGIIVDKLDDGVVIYDSTTQQAHVLDSQAAEVWRAADGTRTVADLATLSGLDDTAVDDALDQLAARSLLLDSPAVSRRSMLRRSAILGAAAVTAAPLIDTVLVPAASAHSSVYTCQSPSGPPPKGVCFGWITYYEKCAQISFLPGLWCSGKHLIKQGQTKPFYCNTTSLIAISLKQDKCYLWNNLVNYGQSPKYHYTLYGTDGNWSPCNKDIGGSAGDNDWIAFGPSLKCGIYWVPGQSDDCWPK